jgi:hypothetical protein
MLSGSRDQPGEKQSMVSLSTTMAEVTKSDVTSFNLDDFKTWRVCDCREFLGKRGLPKTGTVRQLQTYCWHASVLNLPVISTPAELEAMRRKDYTSLLKIPQSDDSFIYPKLITDWQGEDEGIRQWPDMHISDITTYLMESQPGEKDLNKRLLNEYKQGKAYR